MKIKFNDKVVTNQTMWQLGDVIVKDDEGIFAVGLIIKDEYDYKVLDITPGGSNIYDVMSSFGDPCSELSSLQNIFEKSGWQRIENAELVLEDKRLTYNPRE